MSGEKVFVSVGGIHCSRCVRVVVEGLNSLEGVKGVWFNPSTRTATVLLEDRSAAKRSANQSPQGTRVGGASHRAIRERVEALGYRVLTVSHSRRDVEMVGIANLEDEDRDLFRRLMVSALLSVPIFLSDHLGLSFGTLVVLATPIQIWGAGWFHLGLWRGIKHRSADLEVLVFLSSWSAYIFALGSLFLPFFLSKARLPALEIVAALVVMSLAGQWARSQLEKRSLESYRRLLRILPFIARLVCDGKESWVAAENLKKGDKIVIRKGEPVPSDSVVLDGISVVDESVVNGIDSVSVVRPGCTVLGGCINKTGTFVAEVLGDSSETKISSVMDRVGSGYSLWPEACPLADRVSAWLFGFACVSAVVSLVVWSLSGAFAMGWEAFLVVLAMACPWGLGLSEPLVHLIGLYLGAESGLRFKGPEAFRAVSSVDCVILGKPLVAPEPTSVVRVYPSEGVSRGEVVKVALRAGSAPRNSVSDASGAGASGSGLALRVPAPGQRPGTHEAPEARGESPAPAGNLGAPWAGALRKYGSAPPASQVPEPPAPAGSAPRNSVSDASGAGASGSGPASQVPEPPAPAGGKQKQSPAQGEDSGSGEFLLETFDARGFRGKLDGSTVCVGDLSWLRGQGVSWGEELSGAAADCENFLLGVSRDGKALGFIEMRETVSPGVREPLRRLKRFVRRLVLVSSDREKSLVKLAQEAGIDEVFADIPPDGQEELVAAFQAGGDKVAFVGTKLCDVPVMACSDLGVSPARASGMARDVAKVVLPSGSLWGLFRVLSLGRGIRVLVRRNVILSVALHWMILPFGAGILYPFSGYLPSYSLLGTAMALTLFCVVVNSLCLRRWLVR